MSNSAMAIACKPYTSPVFTPGVVQNLLIRGAAHADFTDMNQDTPHGQSHTAHARLAIR